VVHHQVEAGDDKKHQQVDPIVLRVDGSVVVLHLIRELLDDIRHWKIANWRLEKLRYAILPLAGTALETHSEFPALFEMAVNRRASRNSKKVIFFICSVLTN